MENLMGASPSDVLLHGPTKLLVDNYHWHDPDFGIVASYTPQARDVCDHFDMFRGVDMIESFVQSTAGSCCPFLEMRKHGVSAEEYKKKFLPAFISIGSVVFHNHIAVGETFISAGLIKFYKFRQIVCDGRIYKVPANFDLDQYFADFNREKLAAFEFNNDFALVAELFDITGRAIKNEKILI